LTAAGSGEQGRRRRRKRRRRRRRAAGGYIERHSVSGKTRVVIQQTKLQIQFIK
jgi:hypothetical protein